MCWGCVEYTANAIAAFLLFALAPFPSRATMAGSEDDRHPAIEVRECRLRLIDEVQLASERSGVLVDVAAPGSVIPAGAVVAQLRDSTLQAGYAVAEKEAANDIEIRFARKASELAQLKYQRSMEADRALAGTVTDFELRELRLAAEKSLLQLEQAELQQQVAELRRLEKWQMQEALLIKAPFEAFVRSTHKRPGEYVREGETVVEVVHTGRFRVDAYIDAKFMASVSRGDPVQIRPEPILSDQTINDSQPPLSGVVTFVDVKIEPVSSKFLVWAELQSTAPDLRDGQTVVMIINP